MKSVVEMNICNLILRMNRLEGAFPIQLLEAGGKQRESWITVVRISQRSRNLLVVELIKRTGWKQLN